MRAHVVPVVDMLEPGIAFAKEIGFDQLLEQGVATADDAPENLVYAGLSLGVLPAQKLAQARAAARGALLFYSCIPFSKFDDAWPADDAALMTRQVLSS